jgi:4-hydroxy-3-methylbut-2-en-1-yl diphosphate synthase IspG/GcpE
MDVQTILERVKKEEVIEESIVRMLCSKMQEVFLTEANIEYISSPITLVGDIHGQFYDLQKLIHLGTFLETSWITSKQSLYFYRRLH